jgi:hypothetical protein
MKKLLSLLLLALIFVTAFGQQSQQVTDKWFSEPNVKIDVPGLNKTPVEFTTYEDMMKFLNDRISEHPTLMSMQIVGKTFEGRDIPLVTISKNDGNKNKLRVFYFGRVHGNEPSGTDGLLYFIRQLAEDKDINSLLSKMDFFIMPMVNIDGAIKNTRQSANNIDLNRDQSKLGEPESVAIATASNIAKAHVTVDFHEYGPVRADYRHLYPEGAISVPYDIEFLVSGNPNVAKSIRDAIQTHFLPDLRATMDKHNLTHYHYYTSDRDSDGVTFTIGGFSPRSTSNAMSLRNSIALLMEMRGGGALGTTSAKRRTYSAYLAAASIAKTAYNNEQFVHKVLADGLADRSDVVLKFSHPQSTNYPMIFIDLNKNEKITIPVRAKLNYQPPTTVEAVPLPKVYYLLPSETKALEVLTQMGVETTILQSPRKVKVQYYVVTSLTSETPVGGITPLAAKTKIDTKEITLPKGTIVVATNQRHVRLASVLLEPEMSQGFVNYGVIASAVNQELPIYKEL